MRTISLIITFIGMAAWCYVWTSCKYETSKSIKTQIGLILIGLAWVCLFVAATTTEKVVPLSVIGFRLLLLSGFLLLTPLLKKNRKQMPS